MLNNKYLIVRNNKYYFVIKINGQTFKKSLKTDNFTYANILKYKILNMISEMNRKKEIEHNISNDIVQAINKTYLDIHKTDGSITATFESEEERKLIEEFYNTIVNKAQRLSKNHNIIIKEKAKRDTQTLKKSCEHFLKVKSASRKDNKAIMYKYNQTVEYLYIYFKANKAVKDITNLNATDFRTFLLAVPANWKRKPDLKGKNLKLLVEKNSKLLDKYDTQSTRTIDETIKRTKEIFEHFVDNNFIYKNPFSKLKSMNKKTYSDKREFTEYECASILKYLKNQDLKEEFNFV